MSPKGKSVQHIRWNYQNALAGQRSPKFGQHWLGSSNLKVPIMLSSMVPAVSSNARQRCQNLARQPWIPTIDRRQNSDSRCLWMVGNGRGSRGEQDPTGGVTQNRRKSRRSKVKQSRVQASITGVPVGFRRRGWQGNDGRLLSFRLVPSSAATVAGNGSYGRVKVAVFGSSWRLLSLTLLHTCSFCFCSVFSSFFFCLIKSWTAKILNHLILLLIHICYSLTPLFPGRMESYNILINNRQTMLKSINWNSHKK